MDQVTETKIQFRLEQWKSLIVERQNSGMTVREWCEKMALRNTPIITT